MRNQIDGNQREAEREWLFSKGQACMQSSSLPKKYGWGIHFNQDARMAIYAVDSKEYTTLKEDGELVYKKAMRSSK